MKIKKTSNKKIIKLSKRIDKKKKKIEEIRMKRKQHQITDHEFLSKIRRNENQLKSMNEKIKSMN